MNYFPMCDFGPHAWLKKKHLVYVGLANGGETERWRLRFCAEHLAVLEEDLAEFEVTALESAIRDGDPFVVKCLAGGEPINHRSRQVYVTCYPTQDQREDYWARICDEHELPVYLRDQYK